MMMRSRRSVRSLITAAGLAACVSPVALASDPVAPALAGGTGQSVQASAAQERIQQAEQLLGQGRVVRAREMLMDMTTGPALASLTDSERASALRLANAAGRQLRQLTPVEVSLQTAELKAEQGDLRTASAQAQAVVDAPSATNAQSAAARNILTRVQAEQVRLSPTIQSDIDRAVSAFEQGKTGEARAGLDRVVRSGVTLTPEQQRMVDTTQTLILDRAEVLGDSDNAASMGLLQEGVIRRRTEPVDSPAQPAQPAAQEAQPAQEAQSQPAPTPPPASWQPAPSDPMVQARAAEAQALLAEAEFAFSQNRLGDAANGYTRLLQQFGNELTGEQRTLAETRLAEARVRLGSGAGGDVLDNVIRDNQIARQTAEAEFANDLSQAEAALTTGDTQRARELAAQARVRVGAARNVFTNEEMSAFSTRVDEVLARVDSAEESRRAELLARQTEENRLAAEAAARAQAEDKSRRINESIDRVRALQQEMKYEEALQVVEAQILFLDPINPTGLLLRDVLRDAVIWQREFRINEARRYSYTLQDLDNNEAAIAPDGIMEYPSDWPAISAKRGTPVAFQEAEENRRVLAVLQSKRLPVAFNEDPLETVINFIATVSQVNVDVDWQSLETANIDKGTPVTLNLTNVTLETVLNRIADKVNQGSTLTGLGWTIADGVLQIASREQINRQTTMAIYDVRDLIVEVPDYPGGPELDIQTALQASGGRGGGGGGQNPFTDDEEEDQERRTREERTQEIIDILTTNVDPDGWREAGGETGRIQQLNGLLIITNTPANHRQIHSLLSKLREYRALQINVEARFLLVNQDFFEQIGFDLDVYLGANSNVVRQARATPGNANVRPSDFFDFRGRGFSPTFPTGGANNQVTPLPDPVSPIGVGQNSLGLAESLGNTGFAQEIAGAGQPALGIAGQFLDDIQVDFLIKATQADRRTVSLTAPRLTFTNGQISNIFVGTQQYLVADLEPVVAESAVGFDPDPQPITEGVSLRVDGTVSADRRYVTMNVNTSVSRIDDIRPLPVTAVAGGQLVPSAAVNQFIELPTRTVTQVQTTVTVPDQGTILLGGQRLTTEREIETGVPVISKIPILSRLFSNRIETREESTLLILIKPTVIIQNELEQREFPGLEDSLRMPFGQ